LGKSEKYVRIFAQGVNNNGNILIPLYYQGFLGYPTAQTLVALYILGMCWKSVPEALLTGGVF